MEGKTKMARNVTIVAGTLDDMTRSALVALLARPLPAIMRRALSAARDLDDGLTSEPQHSLYGVLDALYGWRAEAMPHLQDDVRAAYASALRRQGPQTVQTCAVREMLGLASYIADGGKAGRIGERVGALCGSLAELRQGPLLTSEEPRVLLGAA
jgi:hypothetical protein